VGIYDLKLDSVMISELSLSFYCLMHSLQGRETKRLLSRSEELSRHF